MATRVCAILGQLDRFRDSQAGQGMPRRELTGCAGDVDGDDIRRYKWRAGPGRCVPVRSAWLRSPAGPAVGLPRRNWAAVTNSGPSAHSPMARSIARAVRGVSGMVTTLPPLRVMTRVWWPRSSPRCSMSAGGRRYPQSVEGALRDQGRGRCGGEFRAEFGQLFVVGADRGQLDVLVAADQVGEGGDLDRQVVVAVR